MRKHLTPKLVLSNERDPNINELLTFERFLSPQEAAELLNVHPGTLLRWARAERVPHFRLGKKVAFRASQLNDWSLNERAVIARCAWEAA